MSTVLTLVKSFISLLIILFKYVFYRAISSFLTGLVLLFVAVLMYVTFYQAYMPVVSHVKPVYLQFSSDCSGSSTALCSYPEASVSFTSTNKAKDERMLMRGQSYKVFLDIEMPPSPTNEKLGMFMVNVKFLSAKGTVVKSSSRSCMLHYESGLVRLFKTVFYSLPLTLGITEEKQKVEINFFDDYIDDSYNPAVQAKVVIMTRQIEIYASTLRLQASFTGLRYIIFNWPASFAFLAILGNFITVTLIYSVCVSQFSSSAIMPVASNNQECSNEQQLSVFRDRNGSTTNLTLPLTMITTNTANVGMSSSAGETVSISPRRIATCSLCKTRNGRIKSVSSTRSRYSNKKQNIQDPNTRKPKKVEGEHESLPDNLPRPSIHNCGSSPGLHQDTTEMSQSSKNRDGKEACRLKNPSCINLSGSQQAGHKMTSKMNGSCSHTVGIQLEHWRNKGTEEKKLPQKTMTGHSKKGKTTQSLANTKLENDFSSGKSATEFHARTPSAWDSFCFARKWQTFKLPRIRRLGRYLQENIPSFTKGVGHCMSDLELSSFEEDRLIQTNSTRRSASASDLTAFSTTFNKMNS